MLFTLYLCLSVFLYVNVFGCQSDGTRLDHLAVTQILGAQQSHIYLHK